VEKQTVNKKSNFLNLDPYDTVVVTSKNIWGGTPSKGTILNYLKAFIE